MLPEDIRELVLHQKHDVTHERFARDVDALMELIGVESQPRGHGSPQAPRQKWKWIGAGLLMAVAAISILWFGFDTSRVSPPAASVEPKAPAAPVQSAGNEKPKDRIDIAFAQPVPEDFKDGRATKCRFPATFHNLSRFHIDEIHYHIAKQQLTVPEMSANTQWPYDAVQLEREAGTCADQAAALLSDLSSAWVSKCFLHGFIEEGSCQAMTHVSASFGATEIAEIKQTEVEAQRLYAEAVAEAERRRAEAAAVEKAKRDREARAVEEARKKAEAQRKAEEARQARIDEITESAQEIVSSWKTRILEFFENGKENELMHVMALNKYAIVDLENAQTKEVPGHYAFGQQSGLYIDEQVESTFGSSVTPPCGSQTLLLRPKSYFRNHAREHLSSAAYHAWRVNSKEFSRFVSTTIYGIGVGLTFTQANSANSATEHWYSIDPDYLVIPEERIYQIVCSPKMNLIFNGNRFKFNDVRTSSDGSIELIQ